MKYYHLWKVLSIEIIFYFENMSFCDTYSIIKYKISNILLVFIQSRGFNFSIDF